MENKIEKAMVGGEKIALTEEPVLLKAGTDGMAGINSTFICLVPALRLPRNNKVFL